jgi:hypothetical protein
VSPNETIPISSCASSLEEVFVADAALPPDLGYAEVLGYARYDTEAQRKLLNELYRHLRLCTNCFSR